MNITLQSLFCRIRKTQKIYLAILFCIVFTTIESDGQVIQTNRFERKQKGSDDYYTIISLKDEGLCLLRHKDKYNGNKRVWEFVLLDTALAEKKTVEFEIENRNNLVGYEYVSGFIYFLFRAGDTNKNMLFLVEFNVDGVEISRHEIKPELDFRLTHFIKVGSKMVLGGYVSKDPVILLYEMNTNLIKVVPGFFQKENELVDLRGNVNNTFNTVLIDRSTKAEKKLIFRTFDEEGEMLLEDVVPIDDRKSLQTSITSSLEREELMVLGSWGDRQSKQSVGFFSLMVDPFGDQKINYFDFASLNHYLDFMKPTRARRIQEASERDIKAGRNPDFANYVMPYKVEEHKEGFFMLAEVYEQSGATNQFNNPYTNPYGMGYGGFYPYYYNPYYPGFYPSRMYNPYGYGGNVRNAEQIKTTQSVLLAFDSKGKLLWDQGMKVDETTRQSITQISDFVYWKGEIVFVYKNKDADIKVKIIEPLGDSSEDISEKVRMRNPADEFRSEREQEGGVRSWYKNSFYVWGYQTIRNINDREDRVRDVFYINKVVVN
ncbi:MAG TPA: hypothetical protein VIM65_16120 [Cyclobacteriaceae bacterium]